MYISRDQLRYSLKVLAKLNPFFGTSFLVFKRIHLPVGSTSQVIFSQFANSLLHDYYSVTKLYPGFYSPFKSSKGAPGWVKPRYASTTLQRITADTFADSLIHPKNSSEWGWRADYVQRLKEHLRRDQARIPCFHLAAWLFRSHDWPRTTRAQELNDRFFELFAITEKEKRALFDLREEADTNWLSREPISEEELLEIIGRPPIRFPPEQGVTLHSLELVEIGPARRFYYEPKERLNIITGDNSLGKTFLLELIWWALTWEWTSEPITPRSDAEPEKPAIAVSITSRSGRPHDFRSQYSWRTQGWPLPARRNALPGIVIYSRFDGSFAVWDSARPTADAKDGPQKPLFLSSSDVWNGFRDQDQSSRTRVWVCNGLVADWISWERGGARHERAYETLMACLRRLSPSPEEALLPGLPRRLPFDSREIPTLKMPYGEVPVLHASAGIRRMLALAYMMVWAWSEHLINSALVRSKPQPRLVVVIDEIEAHLHPRWQRIIIPALLGAIAELESSVSPQLHIATHSPLVMASAETAFKDLTDTIHHLRLGDDSESVLLEHLPFEKEGRVDRWLTSAVFGLGSPRSLEAEQAIASATALQTTQEKIDPKIVHEADARLMEVLAQDDDFWPRWRGFARRFLSGLG